MERRARAEDLLREARELPGEERAVFLRRACGDDPDLLEEVVERLSFDVESAGLVPAALSLRGGSSGTPDSELLEQLATHRPAVPRYELRGEVARGGMGAIWKVWDSDLRRPLAMKVAMGRAPRTDDTPDVDPVTLGRFLEEAQVTGQLDHPGIVPVHELGLDAEGRVYFTMRLVRGKTLKAVFDELAAGKGGWTLTGVVGLLLKVCEAMAYAHAKGVVHRDLKPANVMVGRFGEVYVMDWGLARVLGREGAEDARGRAPEVSTVSLRSARTGDAMRSQESPVRTLDGDVLGTPAYMAPEQAAGRNSEVGPLSDVYSVGAILYHLMSGSVPYAEPGAVVPVRELLEKVVQGPPRPLSDLGCAVPLELEAICERAMARSPADRYASMQELRSDLHAFLENRVVRAHQVGAWAEARKWCARNRALCGVMAASLVLLVAAAVALTRLHYDRRMARETLLHETQWSAVRQVARTSLHPDERARWLSLVRTLVERVFAGEASTADAAFLAGELLRAEWAGWTLVGHGPRMHHLILGNAPRVELGLGDFGVALRPVLALDGVPISLAGTGVVRLSSGGCISMPIPEAEPLESGWHELAGHLSARIARTSSSRSSCAADELELFGDWFSVPLEPRRFLVVREPPPASPAVGLIDAALADEFDRHLEASLLQGECSSGTVHGTLRLTFTFAPLAVPLRLAVEAGGWRAEIGRLVLFEGGAGLLRPGMLVSTQDGETSVLLEFSAPGEGPAPEPGPRPAWLVLSTDPDPLGIPHTMDGQEVYLSIGELRRPSELVFR